MDATSVSKLIHDLRNSLNTISINTSLLRRLHNDTVEPEILDRLELGLREAEQILTQFQKSNQTQK